jgi:hypothetical protein
MVLRQQILEILLIQESTGLGLFDIDAYLATHGCMIVWLIESSDGQHKVNTYENIE